MQPGAQLAWWSLTSTVLTLRSLTWTPHPRPHHQYPYPLRQAPLATTNQPMELLIDQDPKLFTSN